MKPVIEVKGISKSYTINHKDRASYNTIKDDFSHLLTSPFNRKESAEEQFWALKDVSFDVMPGEIFGIIGKNGSGKSTLLKILSRVVDPTHGTIKLNGKTASLLEVGTGFHPELTGRENVYFNGSMLGLSRKEIQAKFDEIVAFSEIEKFIDTPVKFYSSGMYVRLAFSVAAHLDPDILILDEVLAVGDASFQKKSMNKILSVMKQGTTVLMVSHSIDLMKTICNRGVLLKNGKVQLVDDIDKVANTYSGTLEKVPDVKLKEFEAIKIKDIRVDQSNLNPGEPIKATVNFTTLRAVKNCYINFYLENDSGIMAIHSRTDYVNKNNPDFDQGDHRIEICIPNINLSNGHYGLWFRFYQKDNNKEHMVDTGRILVTVDNGIKDSLASVNVPVEWFIK